MKRSSVNDKIVVVGAVGYMTLMGVLGYFLDSWWFAPVQFLIFSMPIIGSIIIEKRGSKE